jgi:hypothetical protein
MRKTIATISGFVLMTSTSLAGIVSFDPAVADVLSGQPAVFAVGVEPTNAGVFDGVSLLVGSDTPGLAMSFEYDPAFVASASFPPKPTSAFELFPSDLNFGGFRSAGWLPPLLVGALSIDTTGLALGEYEIFVSNERELNLVGAKLSQIKFEFSGIEGLEGSAIFHVVPEPATLALLGIGGIAALLRRRPRKT